MTKSTSGYFQKMRENRVDYKVLSDDVVIFRRHNRMYRLSNIANNYLAGKLFVLINANTNNPAFEIADRINLLSKRSRVRCAKFFSEYWQLEDHKDVSDDLNIFLEILEGLGMTEVKPSDSVHAPRQFGKPWGNKRRAKPAKLAQV